MFRRYGKRFAPPLANPISADVVGDRPLRPTELGGSESFIRKLKDLADRNQSNTDLARRYRELEAEENAKLAKGSIDDEWRRRFRAWLVGQAQQQDRGKSLWSEKGGKEVSLMGIPTIRDYISSHADARLRFEKILRRLRRMGPIGLYGEVDVLSAYIYWKWIVATDAPDAASWLNDFNTIEATEQFQRYESLLSHKDDWTLEPQGASGVAPVRFGAREVDEEPEVDHAPRLEPDRIPTVVEEEPVAMEVTAPERQVEAPADVPSTFEAPEDSDDEEQAVPEPEPEGSQLATLTATQQVKALDAIQSEGVTTRATVLEAASKGDMEAVENAVKRAAHQLGQLQATSAHGVRHRVTGDGRDAQVVRAELEAKLKGVFGWINARPADGNWSKHAQREIVDSIRTILDAKTYKQFNEARDVLVGYASEKMVRKINKEGL